MREFETRLEQIEYVKDIAAKVRELNEGGPVGYLWDIVKRMEMIDDEKEYLLQDLQGYEDVDLSTTDMDEEGLQIWRDRVAMLSVARLLLNNILYFDSDTEKLDETMCKILHDWRDEVYSCFSDGDTHDKITDSYSVELYDMLDFIDRTVG